MADTRPSSDESSVVSKQEYSAIGSGDNISVLSMRGVLEGFENKTSAEMQVDAKENMEEVEASSSSD